MGNTQSEKWSSVVVAEFPGSREESTWMSDGGPEVLQTS